MDPSYTQISLHVLMWFVSCSSVILASKFLKNKKRFNAVKNFTDYAGVLEFHMTKAYEIIHKDRVLVYSLDAMRLPDEEFNAISQDFVKLVIKLLGPTLFEEIKYLYGDEDTLVFNMIEYFNSHYEDDEVRRSSLDAITEQEEETTDESTIQY